LRDSVAADAEGEAGEAAAPAPFEPVRVVPTRPDGLAGLARSQADQLGRPRQDLEGSECRSGRVGRCQTTGRAAPRTAVLVRDDRRVRRAGDPRRVARLRAAINAACRVAAGDRRTSYHATDERITIGIAGPDARERIAVLRRQLAKIGGSRSGRSLKI
jgi:hypothetical protein